MTTPVNPSEPAHNVSNFVIEESGTEMAWLLNNHIALTNGMGGLFSERDDISQMHAILDIACGPGGWVIDVARVYPEIEVTGVDVSEPMIRYARSQAQTRGFDNAHFRVMNALEPLDFPDNSFDLVNARSLLGFMTPAAWPALVRECKRIIRPGGVLRLTEFDKGIYNSAACGQMWDTFARALYITKRSFSPDGRQIGVISQLPHLLREAGYLHVQNRAHAMEHSTGSEAFEIWYQLYTITFKLLEPFFVSSRAITAEEFERVYQQMLVEILSEHFCGIELFLTVWGEKPPGS
jgi:ubiquinone/menaquinone biosynthesis C-methylase UbiE